MKIHKRTALGAAGALAASSLAALTLAAAPAQAATVSSATVSGAPANKIAGATVWYDDGNSNKAPTNPGPNTNISLTAVQNGTSIDYSVTVDRGPSVSDASPVAANSSRLDAFVRLDGADGVRGVRTEGPVDPEARQYSSDPLDEGRYAFSDGATISGSFTGVAAGSHTVTLTDLLLDSNGATSGSGWGTAPDGSDAVGFDAWFNNGTTASQIVDGPVEEIVSESVNVVGPEASITSVTVGGDTVPASSPQVLKGGETLTITGNDQWAAGNNNVYVQMCTPGNFPSGCSPIFVSNTIAPNVSTDTTGGVLTTVRGPLVDSSGFGTGPIDLVIVQTNVPNGTVINSAIIPITYAPKSVAPATVSGPATVSPGAANNITGTNWYPGETVTIEAGTDSTTAVADANGNIATTLVVTDTSATEFTATGIGQTASSPFALSADSCTVLSGSCSTSQTVLAEVTAGTLSQAATASGGNPNATTIDLGTTETSVTGSNLTGQLNTITVTDNRGGTDGWSLTADIDGDLSSGSASIPASNLAGEAQCAAVAAGSATGITTGGVQDYGSTVTLCVKDTTADSDGGTTGGVYEVNQPLQLVVPPFQAAGNYTATITITLA